MKTFNNLTHGTHVSMHVYIQCNKYILSFGDKGNGNDQIKKSSFLTNKANIRICT